MDLDELAHALEGIARKLEALDATLVEIRALLQPRENILALRDAAKETKVVPRCAVHGRMIEWEPNQWRCLKCPSPSEC